MGGDDIESPSPTEQFRDEDADNPAATATDNDDALVSAISYVTLDAADLGIEQIRDPMSLGKEQNRSEDDGDLAHESSSVASDQGPTVLDYSIDEDGNDEYYSCVECDTDLVEQEESK